MNNTRLYIIKSRPHLSNNGIIDAIGGAFTDPAKRFEFPVKPMEFDFTQSSKNSIYIGAGILALGAIATALIIKSK